MSEAQLTLWQKKKKKSDCNLSNDPKIMPVIQMVQQQFKFSLG